MVTVIEIIQQALEEALHKNSANKEIQQELIQIKTELKSQYSSDVEIIKFILDRLNQLIIQVNKGRTNSIMGNHLIKIFSNAVLTAELIAMELTVNKINSPEEKTAITKVIKLAHSYINTKDYMKAHSAVRSILDELLCVADKQLELQKEVLYLRFVFMQDKHYLNYMFANALPKDVLKNVLRFLSGNDLKTAALVCKSWNSLLKPISTINIAMLNHDLTGQTSLIERLATNEFPQGEPPVSGEVISSKQAMINNKKIIFHDISRHALFCEEPYRQDIMMNALKQIPQLDVVIISLNSTNFSYMAGKYINCIRKDIEKHFEMKIPVLFVGTRIDLLPTNSYRANFKSEIAMLEKKYGLDVYMECSAKTGQGISEIINKVIQLAEKPALENSSVAERVSKKCIIM